MDFIQGPMDGWFHFGKHGNPPFGVPVQLTMVDGDGKLICTGVGRRTPAIGPEGKERWECFTAFPPMDGVNVLGHWRALSAAPRST